MVELAAELENDLRTVVEWGHKWLVNINASKLLSINRSRESVFPSVFMNGSALSESLRISLLSLTLFQNFTWNSCVESIAESASTNVSSHRWNPLPRGCFLCKNDLQTFKCNVNRHMFL